MAFNPFIGVSQEQLEEWLADAQEDYRLGKTVSSIGGSDANATKIVQMHPLERIKAILGALYLIDPDAYPLTSIVEPRRTQAIFTGYAPGTVGP